MSTQPRVIAPVSFTAPEAAPAHIPEDVDFKRFSGEEGTPVQTGQSFRDWCNANGHRHTGTEAVEAVEATTPPMDPAFPVSDIPEP